MALTGGKRVNFILTTCLRFRSPTAGVFNKCFSTLHTVLIRQLYSPGGGLRYDRVGMLVGNFELKS